MRQGGTNEDKGARRLGVTSRDEARELDVTSGGGRELAGTREPSRPGRTGEEGEASGVEAWVGEHSRVSRSIQASTRTDAAET